MNSIISCISIQSNNILLQITVYMHNVYSKGVYHKKGCEKRYKINIMDHFCACKDFPIFNISWKLSTFLRSDMLFSRKNKESTPISRQHIFTISYINEHFCMKQRLYIMCLAFASINILERERESFIRAGGRGWIFRQRKSFPLSLIHTSTHSPPEELI